MFFWISIAIAGAALTLIASRRAVHYASMLAEGLALPPFLIGMTIVSVGTDIPEIANSIIASVSGHGDLNVGDSVGSVMTQITLVFGLLPFFVSGFSIDRTRVLMIGGFTILALGIGMILTADGNLTRLDGIILVSCWVVFTAMTWRFAPPPSEPALPGGSRKKILHAFLLLIFLGLVGVGAGAFVKAFIEMSAEFGVPEYVISFFGASLGTSLPELVVDITALKQAKRDLAVGGIVGACLVDATLSIGSGPLIAPTLVTGDLAIQGATVAIVFTALAVFAVSIRMKHDRLSGLFLLLLYASAYFIFMS